MDIDIDSLSRRGRDLTLRYPHGLLTPGTIAAHARRTDTRRHLLNIFSTLHNDPVDAWRADFLRTGLALYGPDWDFLDNLCVTHSFARLARPKRVLEIGVRTGMCTAAVAAVCPDAELHLIDLWMEGYGGQHNAGEAFVQKQLVACGHRGPVHFHSGDSHAQLPALFAAQPELRFDLILVDGDHTESGAYQDLRDTLPRLAPGGLLVFDDVAHSAYRHLLPLWRACILQLGTAVRPMEYLDHGHGVAFALRSTF